MWVVRDRLMGDIDEFDNVELPKILARALSRQVSQLIEVVDKETAQVIHLYLEGEEWTPTSSIEVGVAPGISNEAAQQLGRATWQELAAWHQQTARLAKKLKRSAFEQAQLDKATDAVAQRETLLRGTLSDNEFRCCFFKFIQQTNPGLYPGSHPHFCDRQVRRYVKEALIKTGRIAHSGGWRPIGLTPEPPQLDPLDDQQAQIREPVQQSC